jgi:hypothetical protein
MSNKIVDLIKELTDEELKGYMADILVMESNNSMADAKMTEIIQNLSTRISTPVPQHIVFHVLLREMADRWYNSLKKLDKS